jgi:hypothetical protein
LKEPEILLEEFVVVVEWLPVFWCQTLGSLQVSFFGRRPLEVAGVEVLVEDLKFVGHWHLGLT